MACLSFYGRYKYNFWGQNIQREWRKSKWFKGRQCCRDRRYTVPIFHQLFKLSLIMVSKTMSLPIIRICLYDFVLVSPNLTLELSASHLHTPWAVRHSFYRSLDAKSSELRMHGNLSPIPSERPLLALISPSQKCFSTYALRSVGLCFFSFDWTDQPVLSRSR